MYYVGLPYGSKNTDKVLMFIEDLSRNSVFFGTIGKP